VIEDATLANVLEPDAADLLWRRLEGRTVSEILAEGLEEPPRVDVDATLVEVASAMVKSRAPLVVVQDEGRIVGSITAASLLSRLLRDVT
jgi:CBS domain-containing protein